MARQRRNREQWRRLVEGWPGSGLTQAAYCNRHAVSPASLYRWRGIFRQEHETATVALKQTLRLVPVELTDTPQPKDTPLTLILSEDTRIEITPGFDGVTLRRLLSVLRESP